MLDYSSPEITEILEELKLGELVSIVQEWRKCPGDDFRGYEQQVREKVMGVERKVIAVGLRALDLNHEELEVEGRRYRRSNEPSSKKYTSLAGDLKLERNLYRPADGHGRSICPMELRAGIVEGAWTPVAAEVMAHGVAVMTPYEAAEFLPKFGGFAPSRSSLDRLPKSLSERWEQNRWDWENILRSQETVAAEVVTVAVSLDGIKLPMKDGERTEKRARAAEKGKTPRGPNGYREAGCGTVTAYDSEGQRLETTYYGRMPESRKPTLHAQLEAETSSYLQAAPIFNLVCQSDGAKDNWRILNEILDSLREQGILGDDVLIHRIADFYHAAEHLKAATDLYYGANSAKSRSEWELLRLHLLEEDDGVDRVIRKLAYFRNRARKGSTRRKELATELRYFRNRKEQMRYTEFRRNGLPIGTGVIEAACKTLVTQRLKRSGMRWAEDGGQAVLSLRSLIQSNRWDRGWCIGQEWLAVMTDFS